MALPDRPTVSVLVVSYNTVDLLRACLESVRDEVTADQAPTAGPGASRIPGEVIVLDNASTDGSADMVAREFPEVDLVRSPTNVGFARGVNEAARRAVGTYLVLLNPDAAIHRGSLEALVECARRRRDAGIVGGRALSPDGEMDPRSCWGLPTVWSLFCFGTGLSTALRGSAWFDPEAIGGWSRDSERVVGAVSGSLLLVERALWEELGGFDERYFMYGEDIDLASRAAELGHRAVFTPDAVVTHRAGASSASSGQKMVLVMAGKATYVLERWSGPLRIRWGLSMLVLGAALRAALHVALQVLVPGRETPWPTVWRERGRWRRGYVTPRSADRAA